MAIIRFRSNSLPLFRLHAVFLDYVNHDDKKYVSSETRRLVNRNDILQDACSLQSQGRSRLRRGDEGNKLLRIVDYFIKFETKTKLNSVALVRERTIKFETASLNVYLGLVNST